MNLTVIWDGAAGVVWPGLPAVRANLSAPGITSAERVSEAEADVVWEPAYHRGGDGARRDSPSDDMVTAEPHQQCRRRPRNPTIYTRGSVMCMSDIR